MVKQYPLGSLVRVQQHTHSSDTPSKLNSLYSGLCEVLEVRGLTLTLNELDTERIFTASYNAVRAASLSQPNAPAPVDNATYLPDQSHSDAQSQDRKIGRIMNAQLFADDEWQLPPAPHTSSLFSIDLTPPTTICSPC